METAMNANRSMLLECLTIKETKYFGAHCSIEQPLTYQFGLLKYFKSFL
jgi:hypothetical protein